MQKIESINSPGLLARIQGNPTPTTDTSTQIPAGNAKDKNLIRSQVSVHLLGALPHSASYNPSTGLSSELKSALATMHELLQKQNQKPAPPTESPPKTTKQEPPKQETTPSKPTSQTPATKQATYVVKKGDSLSLIARKKLGNENRWKEIYDLNRGKISNPNQIYPGQELAMPASENKQSEAPAKPATPEKTPPSPAPAKPAPAKQTTYVVQKGDSLSLIARNTLGDSNRWKEIYDLNRDKLSNPNQISVGQELALPGSAKTSQPKTAGANSNKPANSDRYFISQYRSSRNTNEDAANNGNCGPTSLTMVAMAFNKISVSPSTADAAIENTRQRMGAGTDQYEGTAYTQLVKGAQSYGLNARVVYGQIDTLKKELAQGRLVIAHVIPTYLNPNTRSTGHYALVTKVADGKVYLNDPISTSGPVVVSEAAFVKGQKARGAYGLISIGE